MGVSSANGVGEAVIRSLVTAPDEFKLIADSAPVPMWLTGLDRRRRFVNHAYVELLGVPYEQALDFDWRTILHPDDHDRIVAESIAGEATLKPFGLEARYRVGDGSWRWIHSVSRPLHDSDGTHLGFVGVAIDITESKEALVALAEREQRLSAYVNQTEAGFAETDRDGQFVNVNDRFCEISGYTRGALLERTMQSITHPDDLPANVARFGDLFAGGASFQIEKRYIRPDRSIVWVNNSVSPIMGADGRATGTVAVSIDVTARRRTEQNLRDAEERLRLATESAGIGTWDWDLVRLRGTWSDKTREILGIDPQAEVTLEVRYATIHPDDRERVMAEVRGRIADGDEFSMEYRVLRPDGETRWVSSNGIMLRNAEGQVTRTIGTVRDVTTSRRAEQNLREAEERLRLATESAGIGAWEWDYRLMRGTWSDQARRVLGTEVGEDTSLEDRYSGMHPADRDRVQAAFRDAHEHGHDIALEYRIVRPDGEVRWVSTHGAVLRDTNGEVSRSIGTIRDVTTRRSAQERLEELNRSLESKVAERTRERDAMWRLSRDLLLVLDPRLRIVAINPIVQELTGYSPDEVIGKRFLTYLHPEDRAVLTQAIQRGRRERVSDVEARLVTRDGEVRCFVWNASPEAGLAFVSGRDVTEERARLHELLTAQEALRQSQKLEAIGQLTGGVAHDFNNLLSPIIGGLDILKRRGLGGEREQRLIDGALQSADRAKVLVQRLLAFARRQPLQVAPVRLGPLLSELKGLLASTLGPNIALAIDVSADLAPVVADLNQLEMAIINLAVNARDAMPNGGTLRISARHKESEGKDWIELAVADDGAGMDAATLARATEPFFSSKGIGKGTGLGLSMVEGLTAQLGGALHIASTPGDGTTVTLCLPAAASAPTPAAHAESPSGELRSGRILIVDDEALVRLSTADALSDEGFAVSEAASAEHALSLLEREPRFDCVVTDYLMPGINGVELARLIRERFPALPVILLSGYAELDAFGGDLPYLAKPCPTATLVRTISGLLEPTAAA